MTTNLTLEEAARRWRNARRRFMQISVREWRKWDRAHADYNKTKLDLEAALERAEREEAKT